MDIYWYWPHPHRADSGMALGALRPGDRLTVQALSSLGGERFGSVTAYDVVRDLPDPTAAGGRLLRRLYGSADQIVVFHRVLAEELVADFAVDPERVAVVPIPFSDRDVGVRRETGGRPRALLFGRLQPYKGVTDLLEAARLLPSDPGFSLLIAGAGDADIEAAVRRAVAEIPWVEAGIAD